MPEATSYDLFISYAEADRAWVEGYLLDALPQAGIKYLSEAAFRLGVPRIQEFQRAIQQSRRTLLVVSPAYVADDFSQFVELLGQSYGQDTQTWPVIPLMLEPTPLPPRLAMLVRLNATTPDEQEIAVARLCADLEYSISSFITKPPCPYPGMIPFSEADQDRFFGRDQEIDELVERLRSHPFVTVIGPSGSGKSSLVFAGLIPKLRQSSLFGAGNWLVRSMRPGATPLQTLEAVLKNNLSDLAQAVEQVLSAEANSQRLLLVIDQFEELFTQRGQETALFQQLILKLIGFPKFYIVLTVRADFYSDLMTSPLWHNIQPSRIEVIPLDEEGLRQAIVKPAESIEVFVEPALVERLVNDAAGEPGVLPLVQETLVLLWERVERRFLPLRAYEALVLPRGAYGGLSKGHRTGLQVAIARRADAALASLDSDPEKQYMIARRIFIRLIQFGEGRADTRRQQLVNELQAISDDPRLFQQTLDHFIDCRLLTSDRDEKNPSLKKVDIAHEALISGWPTLQQWMSEHRDAEQIRRRLADKAKEWERLGKSSGGLLDDIELAEADRWLSSLEADELGYSKDIEEWVIKSRIFIQRDKITKRTRFLITGGLILSTLATMLGIWYRDYQAQIMRSSELEIRLGIVTSDNLKRVPKILGNYLELAKSAAKQSNYNQVIRYCRTILDINQKIREKFAEDKQFIIDKQDKERVDQISFNTEKLLIDAIMNDRIPILESYLKKKIIGENTGESFTLLEKRFTDGALKETYKILMNDVGADANQSGLLTPESEADRMPCLILKKIEELWRGNTEQRCGWYGRENLLAEDQCSELNRKSLMAAVFYPHDYGIPIARLDYCKVKQPETNSISTKKMSPFIQLR